MGGNISVKDVTKSFGAGADRLDVLDSITFDVAAGEFVVVLGPSGKTGTSSIGSSTG